MHDVGERSGSTWARERSPTPEASSMSAPIETTYVGSKRIETGSEFSLSLVPFEFSLSECLYEHPRLDLRIGFQARWVSEIRLRRHVDDLVDGTVHLGIILVKNELRRLMSKALEKNEAKADPQALVRDCYELISAFMRAGNERQSFPDEPHI